MLHLDFLLPPPPKGFTEPELHSGIAKTVQRPIEPAGRAFVDRIRRHKHKRTLEEDYEMYEALREAAGEDQNDEEDEPETPQLLRSRPEDWKDQDHYAVLGLSKKRWRATEDDIKRAYRRKVLKHHPDKKAAEGGTDAFFKCIQKAWDIMSNPKKRRQWDSIDPEISDSVPKATLQGDFFKIYTPVFERESRFSKIVPVPVLGNLETPRDQVESFYSFWFNFESWRSFEMHDEEDADGADSRDEKRWIEKKNKNQRQKMKKEDNARLTKLVDQAFSLDPRIKQFKQQDKAAKEAKKREKELASKAGEIEAQKKAEEERKIREQQEAEEKAKRDEEKKNKEAHKNAVRKEKKTIKRLLRDHNNFLPEGTSVEILTQHLARVDALFEAYDLQQLSEWRQNLEAVQEQGAEALLLVFEEEYLNLEENKPAAEKKTEQTKKEVKQVEAKQWNPQETNLLIKAVKLYPGGTVGRWDRIADYLSEHGGSSFTAKECIAKSKDLQTIAAPQRQALQEKPKVQAKVEITEQTSERIQPKKDEAPKPTMLVPEKSDWTLEQQLALEAGLRQFTAAMFSKNPAERWEKIAEVVPGKDKKDVKTRVKVLADLVKKKGKK
ncbi:hypothetical protein EDD86DRAFT_207129 [Gorgonomyces haynaldii]|nr:hypothetical protein EDD86DRAFT_207129 [Gorgonomyces haynaldii]